MIYLIKLTTKSECVYNNKNIKNIMLMTNKTTLVWIVIIVIILYSIICGLNNIMIFHPSKTIELDPEKITETYEKYNIKLTTDHYFVKTHDNIEISCLELMVPNKDILFIFSHGNAGNLSNFLFSNTILNLLKYGFVVLYDYRGYGLSNGKPSQDGCYYDIKTVWKNIRTKYPTNKIILYGFSLGCYPTIRLFNALHKYDALHKYNSKILPHHMILQAGFVNIKYMVNKLSQYISFLVTYNFDNLAIMKELKKQKKTDNITILHSEKDEIVSYKNAKILKKAGKCQLLDILGTHNNPIYPTSFFAFMDELCG